MKILHRVFVCVLGEFFLKLCVHLCHFLLADQVGDTGGEGVHQQHIADHGQCGQEAGGDPSKPTAAEDHDGAQADDVQGQTDVDAPFGSVFIGEEDGSSQGGQACGQQDLPEGGTGGSVGFGGEVDGCDQKNACCDGDEIVDESADLVHGAPPYRSSFFFRAGTYCREMMIFSPFRSRASSRPLKDGDSLRILDRSTMTDLEIRRKSVPDRSDSSS